MEPVSILITGHIMAPVIIELGSNDSLPMWAKLALGLVFASVLLLGLLQPAKGAIIALQWWIGMHGFSPAGRDEAARADLDHLVGNIAGDDLTDGRGKVERGRGCAAAEFEHAMVF